MYIDLAKPTTYTSHNENMFPCISLGHGEIKNVSTWGGRVNHFLMTL